MASEHNSIDIAHIPELVQIAEEVGRSNMPRTLRDRDRVLAVMVPPSHLPAVAEEDQIEAAKANLRKHFASVAPHNRPEDWTAVRREFEELVAEDARTRGQQ